jgi:WD40 repeat protein
LLETWDGFSGQFPVKLCPLESNYLAVGYASDSLKAAKSIRILNGYTGGLFIKLIGHDKDVSTFARIENQTLASGSRDKTIKIWNWKRGHLLKNLTGNSDDNTLKVWNIKAEELIKTLTGHSDFVRAVILLTNENIASGSDDESI